MRNRVDLSGRPEIDSTSSPRVGGSLGSQLSQSFTVSLESEESAVSDTNCGRKDVGSAPDVSVSCRGQAQWVCHGKGARWGQPILTSSCVSAPKLINVPDSPSLPLNA